jgi:transcriptional regulator of arginine metabolism
LAEREVLQVEANEHMIVLRTLAGRAQGVGVYIDSLRHAEVLGTLAGDDTVLVLPRSVRRTPKLRIWLQAQFGFES